MRPSCSRPEMSLLGKVEEIKGKKREETEAGIVITSLRVLEGVYCGSVCSRRTHSSQLHGLLTSCPVIPSTCPDIDMS